MAQPVFAVIDCNNFFVSCERVFRPDLATRPIIVLSNNDGCAVSRSNEAKALGIPMGAPAFKYRELFEREGVVQFSANFSLYGDLSNRIVKIVEQFAPRVEVYSIDECFVRLDELANKDYEQQMCELRAKILKWTGVPVSIGIGATKTQSKVAVEWAKKHPETGGVVDMGVHDANEIYKQVRVGDIWGIGRQYNKFLSQFGVRTIYDFLQLKHGWLLKNMKTHGVKVQQELLGMSFFPLEEERLEWRKTIAATRSFGRDVTKQYELEQALASHVARASRKLRRQHGVAAKLSVFASSSQHRSAPYVRKYAEVNLEEATNYTPALINEALGLMPSIYEPGVSYYRCGVMLSSITEHAQRSVFKELEAETDAKNSSLMRSFDELNSKWGDGTIRFGAQGIQQKWTGKSSQRSESYTREWNKLRTVNTT